MLPLCPLTALRSLSCEARQPRVGFVPRLLRDLSEPHEDGGSLRHPWILQTPVFSSSLLSGAVAGFLRPFQAVFRTSPPVSPAPGQLCTPQRRAALPAPLCMSVGPPALFSGGANRDPQEARRKVVPPETRGF